MSSPKRILVVGGTAADIEVYKSCLSDTDVHIETAADGAAALDCVRQFSPHLILLDPEIARVNGFDVCRQVKVDPSTKHTMIMMIAGLNGLGEIERAVEAGADDFISKPVDRAELLRRVVNLLKLRDRRS